MKIAWIFPLEKQCGISLYSKSYVKALGTICSVACVDPMDYCAGKTGVLLKIKDCDIVHIQYESSFFTSGRKNFYEKLCAAVSRPLVVSLHEVYRSFPDVFPREQLAGSGPLLRLRQSIYDRRHPVQTAYFRHAAKSFCARRVLVHQEFQKTILETLGVRPETIIVLPQPVPVIGPPAPAPVPAGFGDRRPTRFAGFGFVNPHYDYALLYAALERLDIPWQFTWIGGVRRSEDEALLREIRANIDKRGWQDRFTVTGWVDEAERDRLLVSADIVLALFSARSSSASLAAALGALRPVIATKLPLTDDLAARHGVLHCVASTPEAVAGGIQKIISDEPFRTALLDNVARYRENNSFPALAKQLALLYEECIGTRTRRGA
jgi:glycosyltransferase involved in cell wall biosynthesis